MSQRYRKRFIIAKKKATFVCQNCEYNSPKYLGRCPNCGSWSSFVEEVEVAEVKNARVSLTGEKRQKEEICDRLAACIFSYLLEASGFLLY